MDISVNSLSSIPLDEIIRAKDRIHDIIVRTPLVELNYQTDSKKKIYLKLENLQPTGSFKLRGAANALRSLSKQQLSDGVYTSSAGNFGQALAMNAQMNGVPCSIITPSSSPETKLKAIRRYGGEVISVPYDEWWQVMQTHRCEGLKGHFIHPVCNRHVIAGSGTVGLEILEDLPEVDTVIVPFGGGGLSTGVASAIKATHEQVKVYACELERAAPLLASLEAGKPSEVPNHQPSFVDGMGGKSMFPEMWKLTTSLLNGSITLSLQEICDSIKLLLERNHVLAEGAGAAPLAAAISPKITGNSVVCVISGGNIDPAKLISILQGEVPV